MPVSHVGLTVSHVPSACSFFLSALQPLDYKYVGNQGDSVGFGTDDADFFLSPEVPGYDLGGERRSLVVKLTKIASVSHVAMHMWHFPRPAKQR